MSTTARGTLGKVETGIMITNSDGLYIQVNQAICEMLGYTEAELLKMKVWDITPSDTHQQVQTLWNQFLRVGEQSGIFGLRRKDGHTILVEYEGLANWQPNQHIAVVRSINHKSNPATPIPATKSESLPKNPVGFESKIVRPTSEWKEVNLVKICEESIHYHEEDYRQKGVWLKTELPDVAPLFRGDGVALQRCLQELLANALRATEPGGRVTLRLIDHKNTVFIELEDTGCGIDREAITKIFEPFVQLASKEVRGIWGLGLYFVKQVIAAHGGKIEVQSQKEEGTLYRIILHMD